MMTELAKIKIWVILGVMVLLFGVLGWSWVRPADGYDGLTVVLSGKPGTVILSAIGLGMLGVVVGVLFGRRHGIQMGMLAIPAGLTVWAVLSGNMERMLLEYSAAEARQGMFFQLMGDAFIWSILVGMGCGFTWLIGGVQRSAATTNLDQEASLVSEGPSKTSKKNKLKLEFLDNVWVNGILGVVITCVIAWLLVRILGQARHVSLSYPVTDEASIVPATGQIIFAVALGFFLAALTAHQLTEVSLWYLLICPLLISVIAYNCGVQDGIIETLNGSGPAFIPKSIVFATILPIQFIGVGTFSLMGGYYYSVGMSAHRASRR